jgi:hypothetical protein
LRVALSKTIEPIQDQVETPLKLGSEVVAGLKGVVDDHSGAVGVLRRVGVHRGGSCRAVGILLGIAGAAYILDTAAHGLMANYADYANLLLAIVAVPSVIGELWFTFWLLLRGGRGRVPAT